MDVTSTSVPLDSHLVVFSELTSSENLLRYCNIILIPREGLHLTHTELDLHHPSVETPNSVGNKRYQALSLLHGK